MAHRRVNAEAVGALEKILGREHGLASGDELRLYEYDGSAEVGRAEWGVFPGGQRGVREVAWGGTRQGIPMAGGGGGPRERGGPGRAAWPKSRSNKPSANAGPPAPNTSPKSIPDQTSSGVIPVTPANPRRS